MQYFPLFLNIQNKPVLVVGGGEVASRKVESLLRAGANITLISPSLSDYLKNLAEADSINWIESGYKPELVTDFVQVWATTDNSELNHQVYRDAKKRRILVNVVDDTPYCDFITPSMINRGPVQIAISSGGGSPVLIRNIRERIERVIPHNTSMLAEFASAKREAVKKYYSSVDERRLFWESFFSDSRVEEAENLDDLLSVFSQKLIDELDVTVSRNWLEYGNDVELLTIKALRKMQECELILFSADCPFDFIDLCRRDAERIKYTNTEHLAAILSFQCEAYRKICIFIEKDQIKRDTDLAKLCDDDLLLTITG